MSRLFILLVMLLAFSFRLEAKTEPLVVTQGKIEEFQVNGDTMTFVLKSGHVTLLMETVEPPTPWSQKPGIGSKKLKPFTFKAENCKVSVSLWEPVDLAMMRKKGGSQIKTVENGWNESLKIFEKIKQNHSLKLGLKLAFGYATLQYQVYKIQGYAPWAFIDDGTYKPER